MVKKIGRKECGETFELSEKDQDWYKAQGFNEPKRCLSCRKLRREKVIGREDIDYGKTKSKYARR